MNQIRKICFLTLMFIILMFAVCSASASEIRDFADPVTENMLVAINEGNYPAASQFFDEQMKSVLNQQEFQRQASKTKSAIGKYVSKEFVTIEKDDQYTVVIYNAKFTLRDDVTIRTVLSETDEGYLISGFWVKW